MTDRNSESKSLKFVFSVTAAAGIFFYATSYYVFDTAEDLKNEYPSLSADDAQNLREKNAEEAGATVALMMLAVCSAYSKNNRGSGSSGCNNGPCARRREGQEPNNTPS